MTTITNNIKRFATPFLVLGIALTISPIGAFAQNGHSHIALDSPAADQPGDAATLIATVRAATERFNNVAVAEAEGYALQFGCVTGDGVGAMGLHYINGAIVGSGILDPTRPQIVIYEPMPNGGLKLTGGTEIGGATRCFEEKGWCARRSCRIRRAARGRLACGGVG